MIIIYHDIDSMDTISIVSLNYKEFLHELVSVIVDRDVTVLCQVFINFV